MRSGGAQEHRRDHGGCEQRWLAGHLSASSGPDFATTSAANLLYLNQGDGVKEWQRGMASPGMT